MFVFFSNIATEQMLYTEADLESSMDKIETINFHEEKDVLGVKFWAYNAGHVLGAAMFMIEIAGVKVCRAFLKMTRINTRNSFRFCTLETSQGRKTDI
jgi:Cft2 family RNA processing exonuclease